MSGMPVNCKCEHLFLPYMIYKYGVADPNTLVIE
jgi:hypothetical protein